MTSELIPVTFDKIMQARSYTAIILAAEQKKFAIFTNPEVGTHLQTHMAEEEETPRPLTHELINSLLQGFTITPLQVVINDIEDTIYFARIFFEQQQGDLKTLVEIDARPSDSLALALMNNIPVFCKREVLDKVVPLEE